MACVKTLPDGGFSRLIDDNSRLHLQHGPIDLIIQADAKNSQNRQAAYDEAIRVFNGLLSSLAEELPQLRQRASQHRRFSHPVSMHMNSTVCRFDAEFVTPMAAVAGSVADYVLHSILAIDCFERVLVNNGGDIALALNGSSTATVAVCGDVSSGAADGTITIHASDEIGGIATSGWQGRSHSLGIADAVTVLAETAAAADAAATLIANAVDIDAPLLIQRTPATKLSPDSDLGERLVTTHVDDLSSAQIHDALLAGVKTAKRYINASLIDSCYLQLQGVSASIQSTDALNSSYAKPQLAGETKISPIAALA